jgi:hypothetical protein
MTVQQKNHLGMLTYGLLVFAIVNRGVLDSMDQETKKSWPALLVLVPANLVAVIAFFGCLIYYIKHLYKFNQRVSRWVRPIWVVLLLFGGPLTMPVYWYVYIASEPAPHATSSWHA